MNWIPALTTSGLIAAALWLGRNLILTRLTQSVEHEFNTKLETIRAEIRESEERLKADLRAKEAEIAALRSGAITAMASRQVAIDQRRLEAVDQLWSAVIALAPAKAALPLMAVVKFDTAVQRAERDPKLRKLFEAIGGKADLNSLDLSGAVRARPFLSPVVWATYSAILAVIMHATMRLHMLRLGAPMTGILDDKVIGQVVKAALPHQSEFVDKHGPTGFYLLVDQLEAKLLEDLRDMLAGVEADKASIERAADIVRLANEAMKQVGDNQASDAES